MVSSLIGPQYHDDQFWKFTESANDGETNDFNVAMLPTFADNFEVSFLTTKIWSRSYINLQYAHFHGTDDGAIKYDGQNPGPAFLKNAEVIAAQL